MQGFAVLTSILRVLRVLRGNNIKKDPVKLYEITEELLTLITFLYWIRVSWKNDNGFESLVQKCYKYVPATQTKPSNTVSCNKLNTRSINNAFKSNTRLHRNGD